MTLTLALLTMRSGGCGAILRFLADRFITARTTSSIPLATVLINISGSLSLGYLTVIVLKFCTLDAPWPVLLSTGQLGGYTTYSTISVETARLLLQQRYTIALITSCGSAVACVLAALAGLAIGQI